MLGTRVLKTIAAALLVSISIAKVHADELILNGSFETGDFAEWTRDAQGTGQREVYDTLPLFFSVPPTSEISEEALIRLNMIHSNIRLIHGDIKDEYSEQLMTSMYLPSNAKVLELGGNVGRNSCIIGSILKDGRNLVTIEPSKIWAKQIEENRDYNGLHFNVEAVAVSKVPLIQCGWITIPSEIDLPDIHE